MRQLEGWGTKQLRAEEEEEEHEEDEDRFVVIERYLKLSIRTPWQ